MTVTEKVAFLKGLIEGSELKLDKKEEKIFELMVDILDDVAHAVAELDEDVSLLYDDVDDVSEAVDEISHTLLHLNAGTECMHDGDDEDDFIYEVTCEKCGETMDLDEDTLLGDEIKCPACGEKIEFEFDCDCCCGDGEEENEEE